MANLKKIELELNKFTELIKTYKQAFLDNGDVDSTEQNHLDEISNKITQIKVKITKEPNGSKQEKMNQELIELNNELENLMLVYNLS